MCVAVQHNDWLTHDKTIQLPTNPKQYYKRMLWTKNLTFSPVTIYRQI